MRSMPVPTSGFSARRQGTAWRCMFEPISARFASSCSRNGISEAATDTICDGATSMYWMRSGVDSVNSLWCRQDTSSSTNLPFLSSAAFACAITYWPSSIADRNSISSVTRAVVHLAVRRLEEAVLVGPRVQRQRVDQADVRAFRRLDRAHAAVVGRVHVAHFEARALARQAARSERRDAPLVRDLRQRVGLVHELRQLRRTEELADRGRDRLGVDQVVRHQVLGLGLRQALLDRALDAHQAGAELVFGQLADRAHAAVAEVVDVVDLAAAVAQIDQDLDDGDDVVVATACPARSARRARRGG